MQVNFAGKGIIVGVDPGTTVGVAILDIKGNVLLVASKRNAKRNDLISLISGFGKPLVVSTDRNPVPKYVKKMSSSFGSKLFFPEKHMTLDEKKRLVKKFRKEVKNSHQEDSLAAAIKAWKNYRTSFESKKIGGFLRWLRRKN